MEITVKRDVKIDSDDVIRRLGKYVNAAYKKDMKNVYVDSVTLRDAYDMIRYFNDRKNDRVLINDKYYLGDICNVNIYDANNGNHLGRI